MDGIKHALAALKSQVRERASREVRRLVALAALSLFAAGCGFAALACGLAALWLSALPYVGRIGAPLMVASVLLILGLLAFGLARQIARSKKSIPAFTNPNHVGIQGDRAASLLAAALAGFTLGSKQK